MGQYLPVLALLVLTILFAGLSFAASYLLAPRRPTVAKRAPYECGIVPSREPPSRFPVRFFLVAMIFIVFDVEIIFFIPWSVIHHDLGAYGLFAIALFAVLVFESFVYLISQGALDWGPVKRLARPTELVRADRTSESTIRRVGTEGRGADLVPAAEADEEAA